LATFIDDIEPCRVDQWNDSGRRGLGQGILDRSTFDALLSPGSASADAPIAWLQDAPRLARELARGQGSASRALRTTRRRAPFGLMREPKLDSEPSHIVGVPLGDRLGGVAEGSNPLGPASVRAERGWRETAGAGRSLAKQGRFGLLHI